MTCRTLQNFRNERFIPDDSSIGGVPRAFMTQVSQKPAHEWGIPARSWSKTYLRTKIYFFRTWRILPKPKPLNAQFFKLSDGVLGIRIRAPLPSKWGRDQYNFPNHGIIKPIGNRITICLCQFSNKQGSRQRRVSKQNPMVSIRRKASPKSFTFDGESDQEEEVNQCTPTAAKKPSRTAETTKAVVITPKQRDDVLLPLRTLEFLWWPACCFFQDCWWWLP